MLCFGPVFVSAAGDALLGVAAARGVAFPSPNVDTATSRSIVFLQCTKIHLVALVILGLEEQQADSASRMTHTPVAVVAVAVAVAVDLLVVAVAVAVAVVAAIKSCSEPSTTTGSEATEP